MLPTHPSCPHPPPIIPLDARPPHGPPNPSLFLRPAPACSALTLPLAYRETGELAKTAPAALDRPRSKTATGARRLAGTSGAANGLRAAGGSGGVGIGGADAFGDDDYDEEDEEAGAFSVSGVSGGKQGAGRRLLSSSFPRSSRLGGASASNGFASAWARRSNGSGGVNGGGGGRRRGDSLDGARGDAGDLA